MEENIIPGIYFYDSQVLEFVKELKPSLHSVHKDKYIRLIKYNNKGM